MHLRNELRVAVFLLLIGLVAALPPIFQRFQAEEAYQIYQIVVDYDGLKILSIAENRPLTEVAREFKQSGVSGISVPVRTLSDLLAQGEAYYLPFGLDLRLGNSNLQAAEVRGGVLYIPPGVAVPDDIDPLNFDRSFVGPDPAAQNLSQEIGLVGVPRIPFFPRATIDEVTRSFAELSSFAGNALIFDGQKVLGYPRHLNLVARLIKNDRLLLGDVEFAGQRGMAELVGKNDVVRVHTITPEETDLMGYETALARWIRAVRERNVRIVYYHPLLPQSLAVQASEDSALTLNLRMVEDIKAQLAAADFRSGNIPVLASISPNWVSFLGIVLGLTGMTVILVRIMLGIWWREKFRAYLWIMGIFAAVALTFLFALGWKSIAAQVAALGVALVFPAMAVLVAERKEPLPGLVWALSITAAGIVLIVGVLAQSSFMLAADRFIGVKLMHVIPPAIVAWVFWRKGYFHRWSWNRLTIMLIPVAFAGAAYLILRTGNISAVSSWERSLRDSLEALLVIRPRTKEFLLGYPALVFGLWSNHRENSRLLPALFLTVGTIGLLSVSNTFTHIHTPLAVSLVRSFHGVWLGLALGGVAIFAFWLLHLLLPRRYK